MIEPPQEDLQDEIKRMKFLFDLNGYIVIRNVLSKEEIE